MTIDEFDTSECECGPNPTIPCNFCANLDDGELDAFADGGREGLAEHIRARDAE